MKITLAYIHARDGVVAHESTFRAWDGFRKRGIPCELFDPQEVYRRELPLAPDTLVAGGVPVVEAALGTLGVPAPAADNLPACLATYRGRDVWHSTWGELRARFDTAVPQPPLFVKPLRRHKAFAARAIFGPDDLVDAPVADDDEVLVADYVVFASEWRCFVCRGRILDLCRYEGDVFRYPDARVVKAAIADYTPFAPAGYAIDFGVLTDGRTVLVEVNDGYSLGPYGLGAVEYAELLEARWMELVNSVGR